MAEGRHQVMRIGQPQEPFGAEQLPQFLGSGLLAIGCHFLELLEGALWFWAFRLALFHGIIRLRRLTVGGFRILIALTHRVVIIRIMVHEKLVEKSLAEAFGVKGATGAI